MNYGTIKVDQITFTNAGVDQTLSVSGIVQSISGGMTVTGTVQGETVIGTSTVSGATVTGNTGEFTSITAATGVFTSYISGLTITGDSAQFITVTGGSAGFTTITGATVTGTTANFATLSGQTITGGHVTTASGTYTGNVTAAAFVPTGSSIPTNGVYLPAANSVALSTSGVQRINIEADGDINIDSGGVFYDATNNRLAIGTTSPARTLQIQAASASFGINNTGGDNLAIDPPSGGFAQIDVSGANALRFNTNSSERARIDSSGRLLVGTSSARSNFFNSTFTPGFQIEAPATDARMASIVCNAASAAGSYLILGKTRSASVGGTALVSDNDEIGSVDFQAADGSELVRAASIAAVVDGTPGANDMPGRLVFSTTADGASSPTERMRITNAGDIYIGQTLGTQGAAGIILQQNGYGNFIRNDGSCIYTNRRSNDGTLVEFAQADVTEGTISVSGTTVSYNGAHLSRWSQLPSGAERIEILRGTVLSNIDEMCEWGDEDNEQLNRMKVSDVEGDKNVSGVFQAWDDDDDTYTNDFYCAMTGDFIIRIGAGVTVDRGDLLMSAGDGTAKPQDDDIIRSKTIAKVTSTNVSCTYEDGSYCVPCVLMAC